MSFFKDPKKLGGIFLNEAETLVRKWLASYKDETTVGKRCCVARNYSLTPNAYLSSKGRPSKSTYKLQITSYAHNLANQNEARPRLTWRDLKVYIKLKSSPTTAPRSNSWSKCEDGLTYDKFGYSATLPHFLELLEDKGFAQFVAASSLSRPVRHRQDPDAEEEPEKRRKTGEAPEEEGGGT